MTPEKLMQRRVKVISLYPLSAYHIGELVEFSESGKMFLAIKSAENEFWMPSTVIEDMPALFRELPWYAERAEGDMPEYLKNSARIIMVSKHFCYSSSSRVGFHKDFFMNQFGINDAYNHYSPATLEEYNTYNNQTKNYKDEN